MDFVNQFSVDFKTVCSTVITHGLEIKCMSIHAVNRVPNYGRNHNKNHNSLEKPCQNPTDQGNKMQATVRMQI